MKIYECPKCDKLLRDEQGSDPHYHRDRCLFSGIPVKIIDTNDSTKDEKAEKLIESVSVYNACGHCPIKNSCGRAFELNQSFEEIVKYCRLQLLKWWRGE